MIEKFLDAFPIRRISRGIEIWYAWRITFTSNWRAKPRPYWFKAKYDDGTRTWQCMRVEVWYRPHHLPKRRWFTGKTEQIVVVVEWNNDENGIPFDTSKNHLKKLKNLSVPRSLYGPFETFDDAHEWMHDALDDDMDVYEMYSTRYRCPNWWTINDPQMYPHGYKSVEA